MTPPREELLAGPSGGVPEGGTVVTGDDRCMPVTAPEALPGGRDVEEENGDAADPRPAQAWAGARVSLTKKFKK